MQQNQDPAFAAWMAAESAAYGAIHGLHQLTCGGRKQAPAAELERIARLRKEAARCFAALHDDATAAASAAATSYVTRHPRRELAHRMLLGSRPMLGVSQATGAA